LHEPHDSEWHTSQPHHFHLPELIKEEIDWFEIPPDSINSLVAIQVSRKYCSLVARTIKPPPPHMIVAAGVRAINLKGNGTRLSTAGAMLLGPNAASGIVDVSMRHVRAYLSRESITMQDDLNVRRGPSLVRFQGKVFGRAIVRHDSTGTTLDSLFPRVWAGVQVATRIQNIANTKCFSD